MANLPSAPCGIFHIAPLYLSPPAYYISPSLFILSFLPPGARLSLTFTFFYIIVTFFWPVLCITVSLYFPWYLPGSLKGSVYSSRWIMLFFIPLLVSSYIGTQSAEQNGEEFQQKLNIWGLHGCVTLGHGTMHTKMQHIWLFKVCFESQVIVY